MMISDYKNRMKDVIDMLDKAQDFKKEAALAGTTADKIDKQAKKLVD